jgi:hypothetical protein
MDIELDIEHLILEGHDAQNEVRRMKGYTYLDALM